MKQQKKLHYMELHCLKKSVLFTLPILSLTSFFRLKRWSNNEKKKKRSLATKGLQLQFPKESLFGTELGNHKPGPPSAQVPLLEYTYNLTHWTPEKIISWGKQCFWKASPTTAPMVYSRCFVPNNACELFHS
jgi:hypothetical protein